MMSAKNKIMQRKIILLHVCCHYCVVMLCVVCCHECCLMLHLGNQSPWSNANKKGYTPRCLAILLYRLNRPPRSTYLQLCKTMENPRNGLKKIESLWKVKNFRKDRTHLEDYLHNLRLTISDRFPDHKSAVNNQITTYLHGHTSKDNLQNQKTCNFVFITLTKSDRSL